MVSSLRKYKKKENAFYARVSARFAAAFASFKAFLTRFKTAGRQKLTIMLIPHTEKKILNLQLSFFALGGILVAAGVVFLAFLFSAARFSATANKLQSRSSDLASTQANLDAIRDQTSQLVTAAKRFESALSGTLGHIGARPSGPDSPVQSGDLASFFETTTSSSGSVREIGELQRVTDYLEKSVDPLKELGTLLKDQSSVLTEIPNIWPVQGASHISMYYGQNENPFTGQWYIHKGVDISTYRSGDPVVSTADGHVVGLGYDAGLGNYIIIQHSHGFFTRYGHLMAFRVSKGQKVQQGQVIGLLGNTGLTTGPHLHYEVHLGTGVIDPLKFLNIRAAAKATD
jgi:murein DD-endopeptidase MepM/ murein hydrolase activator NlpD